MSNGRLLRAAAVAFFVISGSFYRAVVASQPTNETGDRQFETDVNALLELRKTDSQQALLKARELFAKLSPNDSEQPRTRLKLFEVLCYAEYGDGLSSTATEIAKRGIALAQKIGTPEDSLLFRGIVAIVAHNNTSDAQALKQLHVLAHESDSISNVHSRVRFLQLYYEQLLYSDEIVKAVRGIRKLGDLIQSDPELQYAHRRFLSNIVKIHELIDDVESQRETLKEALQLAEAAGDNQLKTFALHQLGRLEGYEENYEVANAYLARAAEMSAQQNNSLRVFMARRNLSRNCVGMQLFKESLEHADAADVLIDSVENQYFKASLLLYRAQAHIGLRDVERATSAVNAAVSIMSRATDDTDVMNWNIELHKTKGLLAEATGEHAKSLKFFRESFQAQLQKDKQDRASRLLVMRELTNANDLDYRTSMLKLENVRSQQALQQSETKRSFAQWLLLASLGLLFCAGVLALRKSRDAKGFKRLLQVDALSGALSRSAIEAQLEEALLIAQAKQTALSALVLDIDKFKMINDVHGHATGDAALAWLVKQAKATLRNTDSIGRLGGDEFLIILPGANETVAQATAQRVRKEVFAKAEHMPVIVEVSIGAATLGQSVRTSKDLLSQADISMYASKRERKSNP
jgi:diguanylate cyclase (GGDEF)-like protein